MRINLILLFSTLYSFFNATAALIIKKKLLTYRIDQVKDFIIFLVDPTIAFAFVLILISMFFSMKALSLSQFSFVIPLTISINFIFTTLIGVFFFKDRLEFLSYIGLIFILAGIILIAKTYGE
jgi:multidrug transporter EmrE-like cation transporter